MAKPVKKSQFKPLPASEAGVCRRVGELRRWLRLSQDEFASSIGVTRNQIANIECGRVPLQFGTGWTICLTHNISQLWLSEDWYPNSPRLKINIPAADFASYSKNQTFWNCCQQSSLKSDLEMAFLESERNLVTGPSSDENLTGESAKLREACHHEDAIINQVNAYLDPFPWWRRKIQHGRLIRRINEACARFGLQPAILTGSLSVKSLLTDAETGSKVGGVKIELPGLLARLKKATAQKGKKSELAKYLQRVTKENVPLASVSRWLSGEREPGGEIALQLDAWATAQGFPKSK